MDRSTFLWMLTSFSWFLKTCESQDLSGLDPTGANVCRKTKRVTQYVRLEPLLSSPIGADETESSYNQDGEFEGPQDLAMRPRSRVGIQTSTIIVYDCCVGWGRNGSSCDIPICDIPCIKGICAAPNTCVCDVGWTGPTCGSLCHQFGDIPECRCPPGFVGRGCSQPCDSGTFGENCRTQCACAGGECDPVNGICSDNYLLGITNSLMTSSEPQHTYRPTDESITVVTGTAVVLPEIRYPLQKSGMKFTMSIICGMLMLSIALMVSWLVCGRWKKRASLYRKQSCKRAILSAHEQSGDLEENIQIPERGIASASTITQPNSYMYMSFNDQGSEATRSDVTTGHDLTSLINGYATYTTTLRDRSEEAIYEVKLTSTDEQKLFKRESRSDSHYTEAENANEEAGDGTTGGDISISQKIPQPDEEYEYPYVDCKVPVDGKGCGLKDCPLTDQGTLHECTKPEVFPSPHREHGSTSSSEGYCQADAIPIIKITEVPIDGTYTALIKHPEPEYSTTIKLNDPSSQKDSPVDRSNVVGYVTSVSPVSIKQIPPPQYVTRRDTNDLKYARRPPSARRLKLHQFTDVSEPENEKNLPEPGSYVNDRIPAPQGKNGRIKRPIPAPRARLLPANLTDDIEDMVL